MINDDYLSVMNFKIKGKKNNLLQKNNFKYI